MLFKGRSAPFLPLSGSGRWPPLCIPYHVLIPPPPARSPPARGGDYSPSEEGKIRATHIPSNPSPRRGRAGACCFSPRARAGQCPSEGDIWNPNGTLSVRVDSEQDAVLVQKYGDQWREHFIQGCTTPMRSWRVLADGMPTSAKPRDKGFRDALLAQTVVDADWCYQSASHDHNLKACATMVLSLRTVEEADRLISSGLAFGGAIYTVRRWVPRVLLCRFCQQPGHLAQTCPRRHDPDARRCPRCAQPHTPRECKCPRHPSCTDIRRCSNIKLCCANCGGAHKAFDKTCPIILKARARLLVHLDNGSPFYNAQFDPAGTPARSV